MSKPPMSETGKISEALRKATETAKDFLADSNIESMIAEFEKGSQHRHEIFEDGLVQICAGLIQREQAENESLRAELEQAKHTARDLIAELNESTNKAGVLRYEAKQEREYIASWMTKHGYATGHGDTTKDLLSELIAEIEDRLENSKHCVMLLGEDKRELASKLIDLRAQVEQLSEDKSIADALSKLRHDWETGSYECTFEQLCEFLVRGQAFNDFSLQLYAEIKMAGDWQTRYNEEHRQVEQLKNEKRNAEEAAIRAGWDLTTLRVDLSNVIDGLGKQVEQLTADKAMREKSRIYAHVPPDEAAIGANQAVEPEGERLRQELTDWLTRNSIVGIMLDTPHHYVDIGSAKLPPLIKPILRLWGSIYIEDSDSSKGPFDVSDNAMKESQ